MRIKAPLIIILAIAFVTMLSSMSVFADDNIVASGECGVEGDNVEWRIETVDGETVLHIDGNGDMLDYGYISDDYTSLGYSNQPWHDYVITKVVVEGGVTRIGNGAFHDCKKLKSVEIAEGVIEIGDLSFDNCILLETIRIPSTIQYLGRRSPGYSISYGHVSGGNHIKLYYNGSLDQFLSIKNNRFALGDLYINQSIITTITLPDSTTEIQNNAFFGLTSLKSITIPENTEVIGDCAFHHCSRLTGISIPDSVTTIGKSAFMYCESLETVKLPKYLSRINQDTFSHCIKIQEIEIPKSVKSVGTDAFDHCSVWLDFKGYVTLDNSAFYNALVNTIRISEEQKILPYGSFSNSGLSGSSAVKNIELPDSLEEIGENAFKNCYLWATNDDFVLPKHLKKIQSQAFNVKSCAYKSIVVPASVEYIGDKAFNAETTVKIECQPPAVLTSGLKNCSTVYYPCTLWSETDRFNWSPDADWVATHNYCDWIIDKQSTCAEDGEKHRICEDCGSEERVIEPKTNNHTFGEWIVIKEATCTEEGSKSIHCSRCNAVKEGSVVSVTAKGHSYGSWKITKKATEAAAGKKTRTCSLCGKTEAKTIAQLKPTLPAVKISTPKAAKQSATITWKKLSKVNQKKIASIQIQYSLDKTFKKGVKTATAKKNAASKKITKLKSKKKYYVRIRAYKKDKKGVHVSKWSVVKAVKVK